MSPRASVVVVMVLSLTIAAMAQVRESPDIADAPVTAQAKPDRVFGVLPNYGTVEDAAAVSAITTKATFRMAARNSFDPYAFPFVGAIAAVAQLESQENSLGRGPRAYVERYATSFADGSISSFLTSAIIPTLLKQDPRYFELREGSAWHRAGYAATRTVITRSRSGDAVQPVWNRRQRARRRSLEPVLPLE